MHRLAINAWIRASLLATLLTNGCITGVVEMPRDASAFLPPPVFVTWWAMVESCSGLRRPASDITWYVVPRNTVTLRGTDAAGAFIEDARGPHIVLASSVQDDGAVVRHEMLHALLRDPGHPRAQFLGRCAGEVNCPAACVNDAGPEAPRATSPIEMTSATLEVSGTVKPATPSAQVDSGHFTYVVTTRNPTMRAIRVVDPAPPGTSPVRAAFWYELTDSLGHRFIGGALSTDDSRTIFEAEEAKTQVFDFRIGTSPADQKPRPGPHSLRGRFGNRYGDSIRVQLLP